MLAMVVITIVFMMVMDILLVSTCLWWSWKQFVDDAGYVDSDDGNIDDGNSKNMYESCECESLMIPFIPKRVIVYDDNAKYGEKGDCVSSTALTDITTA